MGDDTMLHVLEDVTRQCGLLLLKSRARGLTATDKEAQFGAHYSMEADVASQELGLKLLREALPDEEIVAEEEERGSKTLPPNVTVFDPADGTNNLYSGSD